MMRRSLRIPATVVLLAVTSPVLAAPRTFDFAGVVDHVEDNAGAYPDVGPGDTFAGSFTFDDAAPNTASNPGPRPTVGVYKSNGPAYGFTATVDGEVFATYGSLKVYALRVYLTDPPPFGDADQSIYEVTAPDPAPMIIISLETRNRSRGLDSGALPLEPPDLSDFESSNDFVIQQTGDDGSLFLHGYLTSLTPEPATLSLLVGGVFMLLRRRRYRGLVTFVLAVGILTAGSALAEDTYWRHDPATSGVWSDTGNWTNGLPDSNKYAYIDNGGTAVRSTGTDYARGLYVGKASSGGLEQTGGNLYMTYGISVGNEAGSSGVISLSGGTIKTNKSVTVGYYGDGAVTHTGGTLRINGGYWLSLASQADVTATYSLSGSGKIYAEGLSLSTRGTGSFIQSGGTVNLTETLKIGAYYASGHGDYRLSAGNLSAGLVSIGGSGTGAFLQTGGTSSVGLLDIEEGFRYELAGGVLVLKEGGALDGTIDFAGGNGTLRQTGGILNLQEHTIQNASSASYQGYSNALLIYPQGFDPRAVFGSFSTSGLEMERGGTVTIPAGKEIKSHGEIEGHVINAGKITAYSSRYPNPDIDIIGGLYMTGGEATLRPNGGVSVYDERSGIEAGTLHAGHITVGQKAGQMARFVQTGGLVKLNYGLSLGPDEGTVGTYEYRGGVLSASSNFFTIGGQGEGTFLHYDGDLLAMYWISIGHDSTGKGTYEQYGGSLRPSRGMSVGTRGEGRFIQHDGSNSFLKLEVGQKGGGDGLYELHNGSLSVYSEYIGGSRTAVYPSAGKGTFVQYGGTHQVTEKLCLGGNSGGDGTYILKGGELQAYVNVGWFNKGQFHQSGGSFAGSLTVSAGEDARSHGDYTITGGTAEIGSLVVASGGSYARNTTGTCTLAGGTLQVSDLRVSVNNGTGTLTIPGPAAHITVTNTLYIGAKTTLNAGPGATIHMRGCEVENYSTDPTAVAGLKNLRLIFEGGSQDVDPLEVAGEDRGANWAAFHNNFTLGHLQVGEADVGQARLVDSFDNQPGWTGAEALYLRNLTIGHGSTLDLNGLNVYVLNYNDLGGTLAPNGGSLTQVPAVESISATFMASNFTPTGGEYGRGELTVSDSADIVVESEGSQVTYAGGSFEMTASLLADHSAGGLASGEFQGGTLAVRDDAGVELLTGEMLELDLCEVRDGCGLLAGMGLFDVTGGNLEEAWMLPRGDLVQIIFQIDPSDISDFSGVFSGVSNITLAPVPEPATLSLVALGGLALICRRSKIHRGGRR